MSGSGGKKIQLPEIIKKNILCCAHNFSETLWSFQSKLTIKVKTWKHKKGQCDKTKSFKFFPFCKWLHIESWKDTQQNKELSSSTISYLLDVELSTLTLSLAVLHIVWEIHSQGLHAYYSAYRNHFWRPLGIYNNNNKITDYILIWPE